MNCIKTLLPCYKKLDKELENNEHIDDNLQQNIKLVEDSKSIYTKSPVMNDIDKVHYSIDELYNTINNKFPIII